MKYIPSIAFEEMSGSEKKEDLKQVFRTGGRNYTVEKAWTECSHSADGKNGPPATAVAARGSASDSNFRCRNEEIDAD